MNLTCQIIDEWIVLRWVEKRTPKQLILKNPTNPGEIIRLDPCSCGSHIAKIGRDRKSWEATLICAQCHRFLRWAVRKGGRR